MDKHLVAYSPRQKANASPCRGALGLPTSVNCNNNNTVIRKSELSNVKALTRTVTERKRQDKTNGKMPKVTDTSNGHEKENNAFVDNICISTEIKSQLKFEVAVSLSSDMSTQIALARSPPNKNPTCKMPENKTEIIQSESNPQGTKKMGTITNIPMSEKTVITPSKQRDAGKKIAFVPSLNECEVKLEKRNTKRKRAKVVTKSTKSPQVCKTPKLHPINSTPKSSHHGTCGSSTKKSSTPSRLCQQDKLNADKKSKSDSKFTLVSEKAFITERPTRKKMTFDLRTPPIKRPLPDSSELEKGASASKRKPGTPWRECELRKLAEQQKLEQEAAKKKMKDEISSPTSITGTLKSPRARSTKVISEKEVNFSNVQVTFPKGENGDGKKTVTASRPAVAEPVISPKSSLTASAPKKSTTLSDNGTAVDGEEYTRQERRDEDIDGNRSVDEENANPGVQKVAVMSRFRNKLTQSFARTMEYFHEVKSMLEYKKKLGQAVVPLLCHGCLEYRKYKTPDEFLTWHNNPDDVNSTCGYQDTRRRKTPL